MARRRQVHARLSVRFAGAGFIVLTMLAGCAPAASPVPSPASVPAAPVASSIASVSPSPAARQSSAPSVGPLAAGQWRSIAWTAAKPGLPNDERLQGPSTSIGVFGWSQGFVAFSTDGGPSSGTERSVTLTSSASSDGLHWTPARTVDVAGFEDQVTVVSVVEGPSGLLAVGHNPEDTCGGPPVVAALWRSTDGVAWTRLTGPKTLLSGRVFTVDAGPAGFIATGFLPGGDTPAVWTSADASTWHHIATTGKSFGTIVLDGGTSFHGGFVLAGSDLGEGGCGGAAHVTPAVWRSDDGITWARAKLPGASTAADVSMAIRRITDRTIVAIERGSGGEADQAWTSLDGRTWTPATTPVNLFWLPILGHGERAVIAIEPVDRPGFLTIATLDGDLTMRELAPTGLSPQVSDSTPEWGVALGPTGLLALAGGTDLRLGIPVP